MNKRTIDSALVSVSEGRLCKHEGSKYPPDLNRLKYFRRFKSEGSKYPSDLNRLKYFRRFKSEPLWSLWEALGKLWGGFGEALDPRVHPDLNGGKAIDPARNAARALPERSCHAAGTLRSASAPNRRSPNFGTPAMGSSGLLPWGAAAKIMRNTLAPHPGI